MANERKCEFVRISKETKKTLDVIKKDSACPNFDTVIRNLLENSGEFQQPPPQKRKP